MRLGTVIGVGARTWECGRGNTARETRGGGKNQNEAVEWRREIGRKGDFNKFHLESVTFIYFFSSFIYLFIFTISCSNFLSN